MLDRQTRQIDIRSFPDNFLARRRRDDPGRHVEYLLEHRQLIPCVFQPFRRLGLLEVGEQAPHVAQRLDRLLPHAQRHPAWRTKEIGEDRHTLPLGLLEENGGTAGTQHPVANLGHFQPGIDFDRDALEFAPGFQLCDEIAKVVIAHDKSSQEKVWRIIGRRTSLPILSSISSRYGRHEFFSLDLFSVDDRLNDTDLIYRTPFQRQSRRWT